jgi:hypothetical protein
MTTEVTIFVLSLLVGFEVISKVPATPTLLSCPRRTRSTASSSPRDPHVVTSDGGWDYVPRLRRDRFRHDETSLAGTRHRPMLAMFRKPGERRWSAIYLAAAVCFVLGLRLMNSPPTARRGNLLSATGMAVAIVRDADPRCAGPARSRPSAGRPWPPDITVPRRSGVSFGARRPPMTDMPAAGQPVSTQCGRRRRGVGGGTRGRRARMPVRRCAHQPPWTCWDRYGDVLRVVDRGRPKLLGRGVWPVPTLDASPAPGGGCLSSWPWSLVCSPASPRPRAPGGVRRTGQC